MRDLVLSEALRTMAADAALRLRELLAAGEEIPYDVRGAEEGSPLARYTPQTAAFIREHTKELMALDSFGAACAAFEAAGLAKPYLEAHAVVAPPTSRERAREAGLLFLCELWRESTDFSLDDRRLEQAIEAVVSLGDAEEGELELIVPLRGFQMDNERLQLPDLQIVRSDLVDVPDEARMGEGMGGAAWQPTFLAHTRTPLGDGEEAEDFSARAVERFRRLITILRLFKQGGVALGPHAWVRAGADRWRRISTGAGRPRPGGYRLADVELGDLAALARTLAGESTPFARAHVDREGFPGTLARALARFEAGLERPLVVDGLNDHLLALRFLLEGGGPAQLGLSMRVAALCAEPARRADVKAVVDGALAIERELWSGEPACAVGGMAPADVAAELEELVRAILKDAACGHLGYDLRATADEILLAEGLAVGEGSPAQRGETAEWRPGEEEPAPLGAEGDGRPEPNVEASEEEQPAALEPDEAETHEWAELDEEPDWEEVLPEWEEQDAEWIAPEPAPEDATAVAELEPELYVSAYDDPEWPTAAELEDAERPPEPAERDERDWGLGSWTQSARGTGARGNGERPRIAPRAQNKLHEVELAEDVAAEQISVRRNDGAESEPEPARRPAIERIESDEQDTRTLYAVPDDNRVARLIADTHQHRREVHDRVAFLFPRPETTEWSVPEVGYDRHRRAQVEHPVKRVS